MAIETVFKYQIKENSHHDLKDMDEERARHACMGYITRDGRPVRFLLKYILS